MVKSKVKTKLGTLGLYMILTYQSDMGEDEILVAVEDSIKVLSEDFKEAYDYDNEWDVHFALYHLLCVKLPYLFELGTFQDEEGNFKGRRIYVEYTTTNKYKKKKAKRFGRFDIAIFGNETKIQKKDYPVIAIELKYNKPPHIGRFKQDFVKLSDPLNSVRYAIFVYCDTDNFLKEYEDMFLGLKQEFPSVQIYYISSSGIKKY